MQINSRSLAYRLLVPLFTVIALITVSLILLIARISDHIIDDYHRYIASGYAAETKRALNQALAELTTARLLGVPAVVEVKKRALVDAITRDWASRRLEGIIAGLDGSVVYSSLPADQTVRILANPAAGMFNFESGEMELHGESAVYPAWGWRVVTAARTNVHQFSRKEVTLLVPIVALGSLLMIGSLLVLLRRNLQQPVAQMVAAVKGERMVAPTGVAEFDQIGAAMNVALRHVQEKEERIGLLLRSTAEGIYGVDTDGVCTFCNPACLRMLGYEQEADLLGRNIHRIIHHSYPDGTEYPEEDCRIYRAYRVNEGVHCDSEVYWRKDGSSFPIEYWSYPLVTEGKVAGAVVTFVDISERRRSEEFIRNILETVDEGFLVIGRDHTILAANRSLERIVHAPLDSIIGRKCHEVFHQQTTPCTGNGQPCSLESVLASGQPCTSVHSHPRSGADDIMVETKTYPVRDDKGAITTLIMTITDVTQRNHLEQQLRQAQKMEAIGQLAGGIAHDFNNILTAITGYASFLKMRMDEGSQLRHFSEQILLASEKAANLTRQILTFSRKQVIAPRAVRVNDIIRGVEKILLRLLGEDIAVRMELAEENAVVMADPGQIEQVLLNLSTNARDAMPAGGRLVIATETVAFDAAGAAAKGVARPGRYCLLSVSDTGEGMTDKVRQRIFEPFFTTKEMGRGTGLGLAIVYGIIAQHEGQITVYSEPGEGTTFRIYLPLAAQQAAGPDRSPPAEASRGTETVLLAEDDEQVRNVARLILEQAGYRVIAAVDGEDAVDRFREHRNGIRLCLFDVVMPRRNGKAALEAIRAIQPGIRAVFMSGYAADIVRAKDLGGPDVAILNKPLVPQELLRTVRQVLDA